MARKNQEIPTLRTKNGYPLALADDGSSAIKVFFNGDFSKVDSYVVARANDGLADSQRYFTGEDESVFTVVASKQRDCVDTTSEHYQTSDANRILTHHALKEAGVTGEIWLCCTIPAAMYYEDNKRNNAEIEKKIHSMLMPVTNSPVVIKGVSVYPEGVIAAFASEYENLSQICTVDIGYYTTDMSLLSDYELQQSDSMFSGVSTIHKYFKEQVLKVLEANKDHEQLKVDIRDAIEVLSNARNNNKLVECFNSCKISNLPAALFVKAKDVAVKKWFNELKKDASFKQMTAQSDRVVFVGGGAELLDLSDMPSKYEKAKNAVNANLRGMNEASK